MSMLRPVLATAALALLLVGCPSVGSRRHAPIATYDIGDAPGYPRVAAGYTRGLSVMYDVDTRDASIAYDRVDTELQHAVTVFLYPKKREAEAELGLAQSELYAAHAKAKLVGSEEKELPKNGATYRARLARFEFEDIFAGRMCTVSSLLLVIPLPRRIVKVRATAPSEQAERAEAGLFALLEQLGWDHDPTAEPSAP